MASTDKINMSLGEIIKLNKVNKRGRGGKGRQAGRNGRIATNTNRGQAANVAKSSRGGTRGMKQKFRGFGNNVRSRGFGVVRGGVQRRGRGNQRAIPVVKRQVAATWQHDLYANGTQQAAEGKLFISNLDYGVSDSDMKELFSEFGLLKKAAVHYDFSGRSMGTAEIIFNTRADAIKALNQYNTVPLDGRPMSIQLVGDIKSPANQGIQGRINFGQKLRRRFGAQVNAGYRNSNNRQNINNRNNRGQQQQPARGGQGRGRGGRGRGGRGANRTVMPTKEELDAQLDNYIKMDM